MSGDLEGRIATALTEEISSADLATLIEVTETAIVAADAAATTEREKALDPLVSSVPATARAAMEDAAFTRDRLRTVFPRLEARLVEVEAAEYAAQWEPDYQQVAAERDALAAEFAATYPELVARLVDLLGRMTECDGRVTHINGSAPRGDKRRLREVELVARNLNRFTRDEPSIVTELKLPEWANSTMLAWPRRRAFDPASFAPVPYDRRHSSEWGRVAEEQARAVQSNRNAKPHSARPRLLKIITVHDGGKALRPASRGCSKLTLRPCGQAPAEPAVSKGSTPCCKHQSPAHCMCLEQGPYPALQEPRRLPPNRKRTGRYAALKKTDILGLQ